MGMDPVHEQKRPKPTRSEYPKDHKEQEKLTKELTEQGFKRGAGYSIAGTSNIEAGGQRMDVQIIAAEKAGKQTVEVHAPYGTGVTLWIEQ